MIENLSISQVREMMITVGNRVISMEKTLNDADRLIGDGDHGAGMARGFSALIKEMQEGEFTDLTALFIASGNAMIASVGGCAGIIFGTFFRSGGKGLNYSKELNADGFTQFLREAFDAIQQRGKAKPGDKTMLDALYAALKVAKAKRNLSLGEFFQSVAEGAKTGMRRTAGMIAGTGRAYDFGQKSLGLCDPGAITTYIIIDEMSCYIQSLISDFIE
jgi:phosphoenolpyruvate---glycerone phosphotransferase subunit DhaL